jgi:hypothetical protein
VKQFFSPLRVLCKPTDWLPAALRVTATRLQPFTLAFAIADVTLFVALWLAVEERLVTVIQFIKLR